MDSQTMWKELAFTNERLTAIESEQTALTEEASALVTRATFLDGELGVDTSEARPAVE